jgi:DNA-nicking Smr family endonuclease
VSRNRRELSAEEDKLWRRVAAGVKPRRKKPAEPADEAPPPPPHRTTKKSAQPAPAPPRAKPPPQDRATEKRVRRGKLEIGATLDLHGYGQDGARSALGRFLRAAQARAYGVVIVITGVGRGGEGVLKRRLPDWLAERELRPLVSGFAQAHRAHGGAGAFYVFIRRAR